MKNELQGNYSLHTGFSNSGCNVFRDMVGSGSKPGTFAEVAGYEIDQEWFTKLRLMKSVEKSKKIKLWVMIIIGCAAMAWGFIMM